MKREAKRVIWIALVTLGIVNLISAVLVWGNGFWLYTTIMHQHLQTFRSLESEGVITVDTAASAGRSLSGEFLFGVEQSISDHFGGIAFGLAAQGVVLISLGWYGLRAGRSE